MNREKIGRILRPCAAPAAAAAAVLLLMGWLFREFSLYPLGEKNIAWCDMNQQVIPLLMDLKDILAGEGNLLLHMGNAGGMNFWGVFLFFLASPFSLLVAFVDKADMTAFMDVLVLLKMMTAAVTASVFFRKKFPSLGAPANAALSVAYAFCGYTMLFYQNIIWLDMMYIFPLLLLAMDRMLERGRPLLYILALAAMVVVNFYISYMVVLYVLLGAGAYVLLCAPPERRKTAVLTFCVASLAAALLSAAVWLPALLQYLSSGRGGSGLVANLSSGTLLGHYYTKFPLLFCTPLLFVFLPMLPLRDGRRRAQTAAGLLLFLLTLLPVALEPVNKMWHTGDYMSFPVRYGFIPVFLGLALAASAISFIREQNAALGAYRSRVYGLVLSVLAVWALWHVGDYMLERHQGEISAYTQTLWGDADSYAHLLTWFAAALVCCALVAALYRARALSYRVFSVALCALVAVGSLFNGAVYMGSAARDDAYFRQVTDLGGRIEDDSFYRVKVAEKYFDVNLMGAIGYNSLSHYTSLTSRDFMFAMKKLGYSSYWMEVNSNGGTLFSDALLGNAYTVTQEESFAFSRDVVYENNSLRILENAVRLPSALLSAASPEEMAALPSLPRGELQQYLFRELLGSDETLIVPYPVTQQDGVTITQGEFYQLQTTPDGVNTLYYDCYVEGRQSLYFDCFKDISNNLTEEAYHSCRVRVNGVTIDSSYPNQSNNGLLYLGDFEDSYVTVAVTLHKDVTAASFGVFGVDMDVLETAAQQARGTQLQVNGNRITARCTAQEGDSLYLAVPYEAGFTARVNGREAEIYQVNDAFMAVKLQPGENLVELTFLPRGFAAGVAVSAVGAAAIVLWLVLRRWWWPKHAQSPRLAAVGKYASLAAYPLFWLLVGAVVFMVYLFPLAVYFLYH